MNARRFTVDASVLPTERIAHLSYGRRLLRTAATASANVRRSAAKEPHHRHWLLLRAHPKRPRRRAAEQRHEAPSPHHSITSSARARRGEAESFGYLKPRAGRLRPLAQ